MVAQSRHITSSLRLGRSLKVALFSTFVLRLAGSANGALIGIYLAWIFRNGLFPMTPELVGILTAAYYATELVLATPFGTLSDRFGRKFFMVIGPGCGAIAVLIHPLSVYPQVQLVARLFEGLASATAIPATLSFLSETTSDSVARRARATTVYEIATVVGVIMGYALGPLLWKLFNDTTQFGPNAFRLLTVIYLFTVVVQYFGLDESAVRHHEKQQADAQENAGPPLSAAHPALPKETPAHSFKKTLHVYARMFRSPKVLAFVPAWISINAMFGLWSHHIPYLLSRHIEDSTQILMRGVSNIHMSMIFGGFGIIFLLGMWLWSLFFTRIRKTTVMLYGALGTFIICGALYGLNHRDGDTYLPLLLLGFLVGVGLESGFTPAALAYLSDISEDFAEDRGTIMGLYSVFLGAGQLLGGGIGGIFAEYWLFDGIILLTGILGLIALFAILFLNNMERRSEAQVAGLSSTQAATES